MSKQRISLESIDFPNANLDKVFDQNTGRAIYTDRWLRDRLIYAAILGKYTDDAISPENYGAFSFLGASIYDSVARCFDDYGRLPISSDELRLSLDRFVVAGTLKGEGDIFCLAISPRLLASFSDNVDFIVRDLKASIEQGDDPVQQCLEDYGHPTNLTDLYPIESRYGLIRAIHLLDSSEQNRVALVVKNLRSSHLYKNSLINSIDLQLNEDSHASWVAAITPHLKDATIYDLSAEFSEAVGGLGRVQQYHIGWMRRLGANVIACEPQYKFLRNVKVDPDDSDEIAFDPSLLSYPTTVISKETYQFSFGGKEIPMEVSRCLNEKGISVLQFSDVPDQNGAYPFGYSFMRNVYKYAQDHTRHSLEAPAHDNLPTWIQFGAFFAKALWVYIRNTEYARYQESQQQGNPYHPAIINANEAQTLLVPVFRLIDYRDAVKRGDTDYATFLRNFMICGTTHTYKNRGIFDEIKSGAYNKEKLYVLGIPEEFHYLFASYPLTSAETEIPFVTGNSFMDVTSAGLKTAEIAKGVSALHAKEVHAWDPTVKKIYGIANGDAIEDSAKYFVAYLGELQNRGDVPNDVVYPYIPSGVVRAVKRFAKENLTLKNRSLKLNPDQLVVAYSGRWVEEKRCAVAFNFLTEGRDLILDDSNTVIRLVKAGIQVVIYGNVQDYEPYIAEKARELQAYIKNNLKDWAINSLNPLGQFIFVPNFSLDDQLRLLPAVDIQIQCSQRATGASEYTESNVTANGGLSMGSSYHEGIIQKHGIPLNFGVTGWGNSVVPVLETPSSYFDQILKIDQLRKQSLLYDYQSSSILTSLALNAQQTAAEYLRLWEKHYHPSSPFYYQKFDLPLVESQNKLANE
ncbi:MAG: hypothetical protein NTX76_06165 [Alphaproteobacteria bacterium]|nr:hypothetical protein [Alphaproteobacteria bacterium]